MGVIILERRRAQELKHKDLDSSKGLKRKEEGRKRWEIEEHTKTVMGDMREWYVGKDHERCTEHLA